MPERKYRGFGKLTVRGFRRLENVEIDFTGRPLAVIVGGNGSGKTSLLDTFGLLAAAASGHLRSYLSEAGGLGEIVTRGKCDCVAVSVQQQYEDQTPLAYDLDIKLRSIGYDIERETLTEQRDPSAKTPFKYIESHGTDIRYHDPINKKLVRPTWQHDPFETSLAQVPKMYERPERFRHDLASFSKYGIISVDTNSPIKRVQPLTPTILPKSNGEETISALYQMRETETDRYDTLMDTLRVVFPDFDSLKFPSVAAGGISLSWNERGYDLAFSINDMSEGSVRFLWLCTLLLSPRLPEILVIDEPEVSLHPVMLRMLAQLLVDASSRAQVIVATHSDRLVSFLKPEHILVADNLEGRTEFTWADKKEDVTRWLEEYSLGELWAMNVIGGNP